MHTRTSTRIARGFPLALTAFAALLTIVEPAVAGAQDTRRRSARHDARAKAGALFYEEGRVLAGGFVGATVLMFPLDKRAARALLDSGTQTNRFLKHTTTDVEIITSPGAYIIGGALYAVGRLGKWDRIADLGWHGTEAVLFAQGLTTLLKGAVGRGRPFLSNGNDPDDYHTGHGFKRADSTSFPSGHSSTAFAAAAAVTNETTRWWPRSSVDRRTADVRRRNGRWTLAHVSQPPLGSDVLLGAAIGTFSGRKIVQYAHGHPDNRLDRIMLSDDGRSETAGRRMVSC